MMKMTRKIEGTGQRSKIVRDSGRWAPTGSPRPDGVDAEGCWRHTDAGGPPGS